MKQHNCYSLPIFVEDQKQEWDPETEKMLQLLATEVAAVVGNFARKHKFDGVMYVCGDWEHEFVDEG